MAVPKTTSNPTRDLKQRVIVCLTKLADRDTFAVAAVEIESIARDLTPDAFSPFISCIYPTDDSDRSAVRRQCVRLFGLLSQFFGDALSPFLSKMISAVVRRLRDPDSSVRSACVDAVSAMSSRITRPPFSTFLKPLSDSVVLEQDHNAQIGSAMCLAAAIEASPQPEPAQLMKLLPKLLKLVKSEGFKAKPALISLIGSIVGAGGASNRNVLDCLIHCMVEHLSSEDWAARKAAAEALGRVAVVERDMVVELRSKCLASLESRRFDKVKGVREIMNRTLELWKEVPGVADEVLSPSLCKPSSKDNGSDTFDKSSHDASFVTPHRAKVIPTARSPLLDNSERSPSLDNSSATTGTPATSNAKKSGASMFRKLDCKRSSNWKIEIAVPNSPSSNVIHEDDLNTNFRALELGETRSRRPETKRSLFTNEKGHKFGNLRPGSRVVPFHEGDNSDLASIDSNFTEGNQKDVEDLSLIRKQLVQIENQQSSLLDLLQKFIGSSQSGMNSLETRVHGLEMALDEISYDLAVSSGRIGNTDHVRNTCCKLPGAEFLSLKLWRRTEARYSTSAGNIQTPAVIRGVLDKEASTEIQKLDGEMCQHQNAARCVVNPSADICNNLRVKTDLNLNRKEKNTIQGGERAQVRCGDVLNGTIR